VNGGTTAEAPRPSEGDVAQRREADRGPSAGTLELRPGYQADYEGDVPLDEAAARPIQADVDPGLADDGPRPPTGDPLR